MRNDLECLEVGITYQADHMQANGHIAECAIDHVYCSKIIEKSVEIRTLKNGSSDHVPVVASISAAIKNFTFTILPHTIPSLYIFVLWKN